ncbi:translational GTPase TypA [Pseudonocardia alni]|uniref:Large ribosomal subunit assembly factor BipA n=1 Tax=Pseudonocardia alni TaxID=33907 RepID=A0AA44US42_PSEA5|nr:MULTISPECIES: translational GTPase TypA [Pseudonocardia]MCO7192608.1 translational GTPase TypA [Pseudonocardia sp. McavD-2-B]MYW76293.1 translational GTPase TypA [Pseudonocardia sp. SID8383]OJG04599.1 GTP-binding protein TypA/BipA [Pseudonocardia autotrophica]PKB32534.1 GTP-binding protein [Pseudonocardia alni]
MPDRAGRPELRNVAIVAHVDHGKTTLVDAMLRQSGAFAERAELVDRVMDSNDLEREKGITILAKHTAVNWHGTTINVVDTPGHADFGGEVERGLSMVDGVVLLVDASEGPLPQTRFVLRKTLTAGLPVMLVVNKTDRGDARIAEVVDESLELLLELADELELDESVTAHLLDLPVVYASGRAGKASRIRPADGELPDSDDLEPLIETLLDVVPPPADDVDAPLQAHVTNLDASSFLGRIALCRVRAGVLRRGQQVAWCREDGTTPRVKITELLRTEALTRVPADEARAGDLVAVAGIAEVTIGDTLADPESPVALPRIHVDEPAISMTIGTNTSPLAGRDPHPGKKLTARLVKGRLDAELVGNVSIRVLPTERPDAWEVQGRGELALAILVETMRREGFELTVGRPQVVTRTVDGTLHEPFEQLSVDVPEDSLGAVTQLLAARKGEMGDMVHGEGRVRMEFRVPSRGLIGFRTEFLTITRGAGIASHVFDGYGPWVGEIRTRNKGSLISDRSGPVTPYAIDQLADRGTLFVGPTTLVYGGMVVGEYTRNEDLEVNITREKKLTNIRSSTSDVLVKLIPPTILSLEQSLEFCATDECVEITPENVRIRKIELDPNLRARARSRAKAAANATK